LGLDLSVGHDSFSDEKVDRRWSLREETQRRLRAHEELAHSPAQLSVTVPIITSKAPGRGSKTYGDFDLWTDIPQFFHAVKMKGKGSHG
jgi:hypothetical protein